MDIEKFFLKFETHELYWISGCISEILKSRSDEQLKKIIDMDVSIRTLNVLKAANIEYLNQLSKFKVSEFKKLSHVGAKTVKELTEVLKSYGLS